MDFWAGFINGAVLGFALGGLAFGLAIKFAGGATTPAQPDGYKSKIDGGDFNVVRT